MDITRMRLDVESLRSYEPHETPTYAALAMAGEVGELCNLLKKELRSGGKIDNQKEISMEIPDILFYLIQFATDRHIDIDEVWKTKMKHNSAKYGREYNAEYK